MDTIAPASIVAALLAGVIVRAWWAHDARQAAERKAPGWRPGRPSDDRPAWPVGATGPPAPMGWRYSWRAWAIVGTAAYTILSAIAHALGLR